MWGKVCSGGCCIQAVGPLMHAQPFSKPHARTARAVLAVAHSDGVTGNPLSNLPPPTRTCSLPPLVPPSHRYLEEEQADGGGEAERRKRVLVQEHHGPCSRTEGAGGEPAGQELLAGATEACVAYEPFEAREHAMCMSRVLDDEAPAGSIPARAVEARAAWGLGCGACEQVHRGPGGS